MPRSKKQNEEIKEAAIAKIKDAGLYLFSHKGLVATSIVDIAKCAGVSVGLMYHYYPSKEELYSELIGAAISAANSNFKEVLELTITPIEKIRIITNNILTYLMRDNITSQNFVLMTQALLNNNLPEKAMEYMKGSYASFEIMKDIIVSGQKAGEIKNGDPEMLTTLYLSSINGLCTYKLIMGKKFVVPSAEMLVVLVKN